MSPAANDDLVGVVEQLIEVITERIVDQLHEATSLEGDELALALLNEKRLSRARRSLEKARQVLSNNGDQREGDGTFA